MSDTNAIPGREPEPPDTPSAPPLRAGATFCADVGTTTTRVWLMNEGKIVDSRRRAIGVRNSAQDGHGRRLREALRDCLLELQENHPQVSSGADCLLAAGMITSSLGLVEVPHVPAPAGATQLAESIRQFDCLEIPWLPILLVPGIRCGPGASMEDPSGETDMMRGEETLCVGLMQSGVLKPGGLLLSLGSHWKLVGTDQDQRVVSSWSTLSGELLQETVVRTVLASSLPDQFPESVEPEWLASGAEAQRKSGLSRALYGVRLLDLRGTTSAAQRFSYLAGAYVGADLDAMTRTGRLAAGGSVVIAGRPFVADAWRHALQSVQVNTHVASDEQIESGFLSGLQAIAEQRRLQV